MATVQVRYMNSPGPVDQHIDREAVAMITPVTWR